MVSSAALRMEMAILMIFFLLYVGIELGIRLTDDIEFAISVDKVTIALGRRITIGEVYGNLKDDKVEMMFANQGAQAVPGVNGRAMLDSQSGNLKAAVVGSAEFGDRRQLREQLTGVSYMEEIAPSAVMDPVKLVALDDDQAEKRYLEALDDIHRSSAVGQSQLKVKLDAQSKEEPEVPTDSDVRRAVVIALQNQPSVPHPPGQSIRVTTLQTLAPPKVRRFLHRLPLGLRLMLQPISYLHPITTSCFTCGIPGCYISALLSKEVFKHYSDVSAAVQRLELKIEKWLADANFCVQFGGLNAVTQVPVSTTAEISAQVKVMDVRAYRSVDGTNESAQVAQLDGIDASVNLPMFLLPHHEHIIPPRPLEQQKEAPESLGIKRSGTGFSSVGEKDNADITFNAHASLPARFDESLLSFVAAIVKASKVIELEKEFGSGDEQPITDLDETAEPTSVDGLDADSEQDSIMSTPDSPTKKDPRFKLFAKNIRQNLKDGTTGHSIKVLAKDLNQSTRDSMKKAVVVGVVNDGWIAKVVGKIAAKLEKARGSLGYSGSIPVPLEPYRLTEDGALSKLLP